MFYSVAPIACIAIVATTTAMAEPVRSGRAQVEWLSKSTGYQPGQPVITALKMTLDKGWHTYWINPGEAGMPISANLELPDGWTAESLQHPFPIRFNTGDLSDFGFEGTIFFPLLLHPPASSQGDVELKGVFSWLTCDDSACVPGDATLSLSLKHSEQTPTDASADIKKALLRIPIEAPDEWQLDVSESAENLILTLTIPDSHDHKQLDVFPLTLNAIQPSAIFDWHPSEGKLTASVPKSPFAPDHIESLGVVINSPSFDQPITIRWNSN